jgi:hypothetical protein
MPGFGREKGPASPHWTDGAAALGDRQKDSPHRGGEGARQGKEKARRVRAG